MMDPAQRVGVVWRREKVSRGGRVMRARAAIVFAAVVLSGAAAHAQTIVLTHATLIDGTGAAPQRDVTIVMEQGRIREIGPGLAAPPNASVIDLTGKFVVPGIINSQDRKSTRLNSSHLG